MATDDARSGKTRRSFLDLILVVCGSITALAASIPALIYLWPVTRKGPAADRKAVEGAESLSPWQSITATFAGQPVILLRTADKFLAYSAACTHLGCIVHWDAQKKAFLCPCHAAAFDMDGKVIDGPPPAPLRTYKVSEAGGKVYVSET